VLGNGTVEGAPESALWLTLLLIRRRVTKVWKWEQRQGGR